MTSKTRISPRFTEKEIAAIDKARGSKTRSEFLYQCIMQAVSVPAEYAPQGGDRKSRGFIIDSYTDQTITFKDTGTETAVNDLLMACEQYPVESPLDLGFDPVDGVDWYEYERPNDNEENEAAPYWVACKNK
jgi:hypothetical protein